VNLEQIHAIDCIENGNALNEKVGYRWTKIAPAKKKSLQIAQMHIAF